MLQSAKRRVRYNERQLPEGQRFLDPAKIEHRFYGMILTGSCLDPVFKDGETVVFDREAPLENGCFANFFYRPELVPQGELGVALKKLVFAPPPWVTFPWSEHPDSTAHAIMLVEQFSPRQQWSIRCDMLLAVHRCIGLKDSPEVDAYIAREWRP
jgi:hypothetical protein